MTKQLTYFIDGLYSAFNFSQQDTKINRYAKKYSYYSSSVKTNTNTNLKKSIGKISISIEKAIS